jgi:hypothetical protein
MKRIPQISVSLDPETDEAKAAIGFKNNAAAGKATKLGGEPEWIQGDDWPSCDCGQKMTFYGQLDSIGDEHNLADCGMIFVFVCFDCFETRSVLQTC